MKTAIIPQKLNLALSMSLSLALVFQLIFMPVFLQDTPLLAFCIVVLLIPFNTPLWSLIHEAIHNKLHSNKGMNEVMGRAMSIIFGASFNVLRFGHIMHHRFNREWESEYYDDQKIIFAIISHYFKMLGGLYLTEVVTSFVLALTPLPLLKKLVPRLFPIKEQQHAIVNSLLKDKNIRKIRIDCVFIFVFYVLSFYLFSSHWLILVFLVSGRALVISVMDNVYHYDTPIDNSVAAKELRAPAFLEKFILNFNHHLTHHKNAQLSWIQLKEHHVIQKHHYSGDLIPALLAQFRGPVMQASKPFNTFSPYIMQSRQPGNCKKY